MNCKLLLTCWDFPKGPNTYFLESTVYFSLITHIFIVIHPLHTCTCTFLFGQKFMAGFYYADFKRTSLA